MYAVVYILRAHIPPLSLYTVGGSVAMFASIGVFGGVACISGIVGVIVVRVCVRVYTIRRRSQNARDRAALVAYHRGCIGGRELLMQTNCHAPPTDPNAPPPYVPSDGLQLSDPPPYTDYSVNGPPAISLEDTPTPPDQPLPQEVLPTYPGDDDPPEYLPPPDSDQTT